MMFDQLQTPDAAPDRLLTVPEFVQQIKQQAPDYASWNDDDLAGAMLEKFPEFRARVEHGDALAAAYTRANATTVPEPRNARGMFPVSSDTSDGPAGEPSMLAELLGPLAHPETLMDFARILTIPVDEVRRAAGAALTFAQARRGVSAVPRIPLPTGKQVLKVAKAVRHPGREGMKFLADEFIKRMEAAQAARSAAPTVAPAAAAPVAEAAVPVAAVPRPPPVIDLPPVPVAPSAPATVLTPASTPSAAAAALPDQKALNEAAIAARRAAYRAKQAEAAAPTTTPTQVAQAVQTVEKAAKVKLTGAETKAAMDLVKRGLTPADALAAVLQQRALLEKFGGGAVSDAAAKAAIKARRYKS